MLERKKVYMHISRFVGVNSEHNFISEPVQFYVDYNTKDKVKEVVEYRKFSWLWLLGFIGIMGGFSLFVCLMHFYVHKEVTIPLVTITSIFSLLPIVRYIAYRFDNGYIDRLNKYLINTSWLGQGIMDYNEVEYAKFDEFIKNRAEQKKAKRVECARRILEDKSPEELVRFLEIYADKKDTSILDLYEDDLG